MAYTNFEVGETFPLPIAAKGDGGLFQVDANGAMFILQLSRTDVIAHEAFRTGEIELALAEVDGIMLLLYKIDGIFKDGWGDAPLAVHLLAKEQLPTEKSLADETIHLYLVDPRLNVLLSMRQASVKNEAGKAEMTGDFWGMMKKHALAVAADPEGYSKDFNSKLGRVYMKYQPGDLVKIAQARLKILSTLAMH
ncbi:MAG: hypothetical protein Q4D07_06385 [Selenomonadaceae bacterium]|nr:hypothetical protein [Selenomonadaceae bacterium]